MSSNDHFTVLWDFLLRTIPFGRPLLNPGVDEIAIVAPHLERDEIQELLDRSLNERVAFIGPGLAIRGALHHYFLISAAGQRSLYRSHALRLRASYACTKPPANMIEPTLPYIERAVDFAEINWGDHMSWDRASDAVHGSVIPPPGSGKEEVEFVTLFDMALAGLMMRDNPDEPVSELLDDQSLGTFRSRFAAEEALGQRTPYKANFCGRCGGGLSRTRCSFCGTVYDFGGLQTSDWPYPLCLTMVAAVAGSDYTFEIDPIEARKAEHRKWAKSDFLLTKPDTEPPLRSIMLGDKP